MYGQPVETFLLISQKIGTKVVPDSVEARHILLPVAENDSYSFGKADNSNVIKRQRNFAEMATEFSEDLGSAQKGGDLGYFTEGNDGSPF